MSEAKQIYHIPVLLNESVDGMNIQPGGIYVDATFGGGGHSKEILSRLDSTAHLYSFDQDEDAEKNIVSDSRFTFVRSNFRYLSNFLRYYDVEEVDAILADLGVSSHHFDDSERGFSFRFEGKLDMRMNKRAGMTAADVVNTYDEERLANIFYLYGELKNSRKLASTIVKARGVKQIITIGDFLEVIKPLFGREREKKETRKGVPSFTYRGKSGNGSIERNALCSNQSTETGRQTGSNHLSFLRGPHGKKYHENRKHRRQGRTGFLW